MMHTLARTTGAVADSAAPIYSLSPSIPRFPDHIRQPSARTFPIHTRKPSARSRHRLVRHVAVTTVRFCPLFTIQSYSAGIVPFAICSPPLLGTRASLMPPCCRSSLGRPCPILPRVSFLLLHPPVQHAIVKADLQMFWPGAEQQQQQQQWAPQPIAPDATEQLHQQKQHAANPNRCGTPASTAAAVVVIAAFCPR